MNIFNSYKNGIKNIYSKQEEIYISLENSNCDKYLINNFLLQYLRFIQNENKKLDNSNLFEYKQIIEKNMKRRNKILDILTSNNNNINFCERLNIANIKLTHYYNNN
jgi:hypothetical protein